MDKEDLSKGRRQVFDVKQEPQRLLEAKVEDFLKRLHKEVPQDRKSTLKTNKSILPKGQ